MNSTTFLTGNKLTQRRWQKVAHWNMEQLNPLLRLAGQVGSEMPFIINAELQSNPGDLIIFHQVQEPANTGIGDGGRIKDNEETLPIFNFEIKVHERGNGIASGTPISSKRTQYDQRQFLELASMGLTKWAANVQEKDMRYAISGIGNQATYVGQGTSNIDTVNERAPSSLRIKRGGQDSAGVVTFVDTLLEIGDGTPTIAQSLFGMALIRKMNAVMLTVSPKIKPVPFTVTGGGSIKYLWPWLISPFQSEQLQKDSTWNANQQSANVRDIILNPLWGKSDMGLSMKRIERPFIGAIGIVGDFLLITYSDLEFRVGGEFFESSGDAVHANIVDGTNRIDRSIILGQEAAVLSWGKMWTPHTDDTDYQRIRGVAVDSIYGVGKFTPRDPGASQTTNTAPQDQVQHRRIVWGQEHARCR